MCGRLAEDSSNLKKGSSLDKLLARVRLCRKAGTQVSLDGGGSGHRRRMQTGYTGSSCSRKILPHRIADYNAACCPHGATSCPNGMPKSCSAECAAVYDPFYAACKKNFPKSSKKNMQTLLGMCAKVPTAPIAGARPHIACAEPVVHSARSTACGTSISYRRLVDVVVQRPSRRATASELCEFAQDRAVANA